MAKKTRTGAKGKLSGNQIARLRRLLEKAVRDGAFRRRLLANPRKVLAQAGLGLSPAQLRQVDKFRRALLQKAREVEKAAAKAARNLSDKARLSWPTLR